MATYDPRVARVAVFGGAQTSGMPASGIWDWNGTAWSQRALGASSGTPPTPFLPGLAYDTARDTARAVLLVFNYSQTLDEQLGFQLRPAGAPATSEPEARLSADYLEVRVRYVAP